MIELDKSRDELLAAIGASEALFRDPAVDVDSRDLVAREQIHFEMSAHTRDEILPVLRGALLRRFDWLSEGRLFHELFLPLKRGLGNAFKRGNDENAEKWIRAQVAFTRAGVFVEIRDEGSGFDVEDLLTRFRGNERYWTNHGSGFVTLERSTATVSYADGGRTLRISYRCPPRDQQDATFAGADDERFMSDVLQAGFPGLKKQRGVLHSLRIGEPAMPVCPRRRELGYELEVQPRGQAESEHLALTGRILDPEAAQTDYAVARTLARGPFRTRRSVRIPEPISAFKGQPQVVFYPLQNVQGFEPYLKGASDAERLDAVSRVAAGLQTWHRCGLKPMKTLALEDWLSNRAKAAESLCDRIATERPACEPAVRRAVSQLAAMAPKLLETELLPIHGGFDWDCIVSSEGELFFYEFEHACAGHPALDVAAFVADLRAFGGGEVAPLENAFLTSYEPGDWRADLEFFVAHAALRRLDACLEEERGAPVDLWIGVLGRSLDAPAA